MSSAGSPEQPVSHLWLLALAFGVCGLVCAATVGLQAAAILMAIVFPPEPPVPEGAVLVAHTNAAHGVDTWRYRINLPPCDMVAFFKEKGGRCVVRDGWCGGADPGLVNIGVAQCSGDIAFSVFAQRWQARISIGSDQNVTDLTLSREISWMGALPPGTMPPL